MKLLLVLFIALAAASAHPKMAPRGIQTEMKPSDKNGRILGGDSSATRQDFPWNTLNEIQSSSSSFYCGGALVSKQFVLTAGHCVADVTTIKVTMGKIDLKSDPDVGEVIVSEATGVLHEGYVSLTFENDIGLIDFVTPISLNEFNEFVKFISLDTIDTVLTAGVEDVTISGFGITSEDSKVLSDTLNFAQLKIISNEECEIYYGEGSIEPFNNICTKDDAKSPCYGDSGCPLVLPKNEENEESEAILVGIVSFVSSKGCNDGPTGYTRISQFYDWIMGKIDSPTVEH